MPPTDPFAALASLVPGLEAMEADRKALADVRTLDDCDPGWGMFDRPPGHGVGCRVQGKLFDAPTADAARAKAAVWVREGKK